MMKLGWLLWSQPLTKFKMSFPKPSGNNLVGCADIISKCGPERCLFRIFYPAQESENCTEAKWLPSHEYANGFMDFMSMKRLSWIFRHMFAKTLMPALLNADIKQDAEKLPVVIYSHGLGGNRTTYCNTCIELASQGFLVASLEHADESASATFYLEPDANDKEKFEKKWLAFKHVKDDHPEKHSIRNKQVHRRAGECISVLDHLNEINQGNFEGVGVDLNLQQFKGKLDLSKTALVGHSFGGGSIIAAMSKDDRFKVGVALDSWMFPLDKTVYKKVSPIPILFINSETFHWPSNVASIRKLDCDTHGIESERKVVTMVGSVHQSQSDFPLLIGWTWLAQKFRLQGTADPRVLSRINNKLILAFIGKHLQLSCTGEVDDIVKNNEDLLMFGSNVKVDEERIIKSKQEIRSSI